MQLVLQCLDGRVLARKARTYRVIEMNGCDFFHYRPVAGDVADPPAGHPVGFTESIDDEHFLLDVGICVQADVDALQRGLSRSEEHTSELQSRLDLVCRLLLDKKIKIVQY